MTTAADSTRLAGVRRHGTAPELAVRSAASSLGLRYTLKNRDLPGSPDLANRLRRFAIFVHGCFWHRHAGCSRATTPKSNRAYWCAKFERNRARDRNAVRALRAQGYTAVVIWECEADRLALLTLRLRPLARPVRNRNKKKSGGDS
jgi:DNA mismatch endonuclease (patch repair protein)